MPPEGPQADEGRPRAGRSRSCATASTGSASSEPEIRTQGNDQITIQLPGVKDPETAAKIIGKTAQLELYDLEANLVPPSIDAQRFPVAKASVYELLAGQQALAKKGTPDQYWLFNKQKKLVVGPVTTEDGGAREARRARCPRAGSSSPCRRGRSSSQCGIGEVVCPGVQAANPTQNYWYLFKYTPPTVPEMTGSDLKLSGTRQDFDTQTNEPIVTMQFTKKGAKKFAEITRAEAQRGQAAVEHDRTGAADRRSTSRSSSTARSSRGRRSTGSSTRAASPARTAPRSRASADISEAKNLALVLQTGALPGRVRHARPDGDLGDARQGLAERGEEGGDRRPPARRPLPARSSTASSALVAVLGLGIYAAFLYAAILLFNVTLTLPGFAGLVLTLGVAADANVVIFERIKEEARAGRSVRAAIQTGYTKGFHTIVDANVVTAITALVLFAVATSSVRGFALMLLIGTAISMLTAVLATRAFLSLLAGIEVAREPEGDRRSRAAASSRG